MQTRVTFRDLPHSEAIERHILERAAKLEAFHREILFCRALVEAVQKHKHQGKLYNIRLDLTMPRGEIAVNRHADEDVFVAIRDAFDAARRQVEDHVRKIRGHVKAHPPAFHGRIARIFPAEGFGFIEALDGRELYFAGENMVEDDFDRLNVGDEVQFLEETGSEGLQAKRVATGRHRPVP